MQAIEVSSSRWWGESCERRGEIILPALLKTRSTGAELVGTDKVSRATILRIESEFDQYSKQVEFYLLYKYYLFILGTPRWLQHQVTATKCLMYENSTPTTLHSTQHPHNSLIKCVFMWKYYHQINGSQHHTYSTLYVCCTMNKQQTAVIYRICIVYFSNSSYMYRYIRYTTFLYIVYITLVRTLRKL